MSLVRHKDKKSGSIIVYESTSHYDPVTKSSRPKRKYLGIEDPVTGELIPSSGRRGRRKSNNSEGAAPRKEEPDYKALFQDMEKTLKEKDRTIQALEKDNARLRLGLERLGNMAFELLKQDK